MSFKKIISLIPFLVLVFIIQFVGYIFTASSVSEWYPTLLKPTWTPPPWLFGPVWSFLYILIALSGWLVFIQLHFKRKGPFIIYGVQLLFNLLWSYFFFFLKSPSLALLDILALLIMIFLNMIVFAKISRLSALILIPYLLWTLYAASLNAAIWSLNR